MIVRVTGRLPGVSGVLLAIAAAACGESGRGTAQATPAGEPAPADAAPVVVREPPRIERTIWRLAPNRHLAHDVAGGDLVIDAGAPGFARYTRFGLPAPRWRRGEVDGEPAAALVARAGALDLPLTAAQAGAARELRLRVHAARAGRVTLELDGDAVAEVAVGPGWQELAVPYDRWREGEHRLVVRTRAGLHLRWIHVARRPVADPLAGPTWVDGALHVPDEAGLAWYLQVPEGAALVADVSEGCAIDVAATTGDATAITGRLAGPAARVELSRLAGAVARVELIARECPAGGHVRDARITVPGAAPPAPPDGPPPRFVILWVMDTLRADRVPTFTPGARAETPHLDALGRTAAVFRGHYVGGNESQVSHASMFTGLYPAVHTIRTAGARQNFTIPRDLPILGRILRDAGVHTIGVTGNGFVNESGGYARGFREFRNLMREKGVKNGVIFGDRMLDDLVPRLAKARDGADGPVFAFLGTIDTHSPLIARKPWIDRYSKGYRGPMRRSVRADVLGLIRGKMGCHTVPPPAEIERLRAMYDSAISYQDALVGELQARLAELGIAEETMIVITSDHGEELFEEDRCGHGASLRESLVRVPMLVHYPPRFAARVVDEGTEGVDVLPTILDALGIPVPAGVQGASLRGLAAGDGAGWPQPAFASQYEYAFAMRLGRWKARVGKRGTPLVYDLEADPDERTDLAATRPYERRYLTDHLGLYLSERARWTKATWGVVSNMTEHGARALEEPPR